MNGLVLYKHLRATGDEGSVLVLTASDRNDPILEEFQAELDGESVLLKPFDADVLDKRVQLLLARRDNALNE